MAFSSYEFILLFLPVMLAGYWLLRKHQSSRHIWLLIASYIFYGYADWRFLPLLWFSTALNYGAARQITTAQKKRFWLYLTILLNLMLLGFFKYHNFFSNAIGDILFPLGISFYTFQNISYLLDIYQNRTQPETSLLKYALYIAIFPHLIAGPILRYGEMAPQLHTPESRINAARIDRGILFFVMGLAKKVIIADQVAVMINPMLADYTDLQFFKSWLVAIGYTLQIYFDFSGYSDMAIGLAALLGFDFPRNFDNPYMARDIVDFWRRWHITLTNWLRDYIFLPASRAMLRRSWHRLAAMMSAYLLTMTISGIWHGTGMTFFLWGLYHGVLICIFQAWRWFKMPVLPAIPVRLITFMSVVIGWVLFRAESLAMAGHLYRSMTGLNGFESLQAVKGVPYFGVYMVGLLLFAFIASHLKMDTWDLPVPAHPVFSVALAAIFLTCLMLLAASSPFVYFQF